MLCARRAGYTSAQFFTEDEVTVRLTKEEAEFFGNYKKLPPNIRESVNNIVNSIVTGAKQ